MITEYEKQIRDYLTKQFKILCEEIPSVNTRMSLIKDAIHSKTLYKPLVDDPKFSTVTIEPSTAEDHFKEKIVFLPPIIAEALMGIRNLALERFVVEEDNRLSPISPPTVITTSP